MTPSTSARATVAPTARLPTAEPSDEVPTGLAPPRRRPSVALFLLGRVVNALWPLALILVAWWAWVRLGHLPPAVAPDPSGVLTFIAHDPGSFALDALRTAGVVLGGLVVGAVAGALLATVSWFSRLARAVISGPALLSQCLPVATISPVLAKVFGYNTTTIVIITALIAFFPVMVFTASGLARTPAGADDLFVVLGARRLDRFFRLAVPSALPRLLVSLRVSIVVAVAGAMLAQWVMGTSGLGYRLIIAQSSFRTSEAWACSVVSIVLSVILYSIVSGLCRLASERFE
ncbi:putative ABC-type transporter, integral membrane subunit [Frankia canadensis]|uniref:Putative ABC-type transporter, integral membrane subunit n=1 Tax=Frankia canadensis TaxID=1836972 RepID=A0A2I2KIC9_9ACTN|nr:ABC transporter permease subunit [Frankia canadensis]SNQ45422.1 putative ABC-type transporter, integral membrane subunit [Frankia canadensis]SOU52712.1 putative ABC-type transporter, integral membrane subunit [Frankia canadensis]